MKPSYRLITTIVLDSALLASTQSSCAALTPDELLRSALE